MYLSVWPLPGANEIAVAHALRAELGKIAPTLPPGTEINLAFDGAVYMENALKEIGTTLGETIMIVGLIVFLFLGSVRTALVPLVAIPISLIGATAAMLALGFSLNLLTVLAIVLAVGLVVDDAIVVVENVCRYMREGMGRVEAALTSSRQLFAPIVAMTITLAAVYAPIGFLSGLTGALFKEFVFTLAMAVIMSGIVAVTLSPIMSAYMAPESGREGRFTRMVGYAFDRLRDGYGVVLDGVLRFRVQVLAFGAFICVLAMPLYMFSGKELAPVEDQGVVFLLVTSAPDATLDYTAHHMDKVYKTGAALPEFQKMFEVVFPSNGFGGYLLKDWHDRERTAHEIQPEVFGTLSGIEELQVFAALPPALPGAGNYDVELVIKGTGTAEEAAGYAAELVGAAFASGKFMFADTDLKVDLPQVRLVIDRERVADLGLDLAEVGRQLGILLAGDYVNRFTMEGRAYKVIPQVGRDARASAAQLLDYKIRTRDGMQVPFGAVARLETSTAPRTLARFQQADSFRVQGGVVPGVTKADGLATLEAAARAILPAGYSIDYAGESRQIRQEGSTLVGTLGFAVLMIYLVLAAQFGSFRDPLVVLLGSVPLALSGALAFTFLGFTTVNIYSQIGLITLVGLIAKNGILIVEFANRLQRDNRSKIAAIREASMTRLRPVLMTTAATVFGHMPLVFVTGAGAEARNSIGIMLVTGMSIGTLFTLFILPAVYMLLAADHRPEAAREPEQEQHPAATVTRLRRPARRVRHRPRADAPGRRRAAAQQGRLAALVLLGAEHRLPGLLVRLQIAPPVGQDLDAALHRRPRRDLVEPAHEVRILGALDALALGEAGPRPDRDVGDAVVVAREIGVLFEAAVDHAVEAVGLVAIAVAGVLDVLWRILQEMVRLAEHRADAAHLEHQPLQHAVAPARIGRQELAGLLGEVDQDRAGFEHRDRLAVGAVGIDHGRHLVVRRDLEELGLELVARADVDRDHVVGQPAFLEHDVDLVAVGRGPRVEVDHGQLR